VANIVRNTMRRPIKSDTEAQKSLPRPLKMEAMARMVPPAMASSAVPIPGVDFLMTSWAIGESCEISPRPAETFRNR